MVVSHGPALASNDINRGKSVDANMATHYIQLPPLNFEQRSTHALLPGGMPPFTPQMLDEGSAFREFYSKPQRRRGSIPKSHVDRGGRLQQTILDSWYLAEPTQAQIQEIRRLLVRLNSLFNNRSGTDNESGDRYRVDVFGSMAWGGSTGRGADLDLVIIVGILLTVLISGYTDSTGL